MFSKALYTCLSALNNSNTWYVSNDGSDDNDCHSAAGPCRSLQTVLDRATDGADIYVTSDSLSLDGVHNVVWFSGMSGVFDPEMLNCCQLSSSLSFSLSSLNENLVNITCAGHYSQYITPRKKGINNLFSD